MIVAQRWGGVRSALSLENMRKVLLFVFALALTAQIAQGDAGPPAEGTIRHLLDEQTADWNRGDVEAFMSVYENSPDTTFVGDKVEYGYAAILARYKRRYATTAAMGKLTFSHLAIRTLDAHYAVATGNFHLDRTKEGGGNADGIFSLLWRNGSTGWKVILDHSNRVE
jgi:uncharacterized protein (TIGR02246 family)